MKRVKLLGSESQVVDELQGSRCLAERTAGAGVENAGVELRVGRGRADVDNDLVLSRPRGGRGWGGWLLCVVFCQGLKGVGLVALGGCVLLRE